MTAIDDVKTLGRGTLSFADGREIDDFVQVLGRYERGEISADDWRKYRLVRGTYGQRQEGTLQMLRVKIPQGILSAEQLRALADGAERYSRGFGHITTRQNIQFHFIQLEDVSDLMRDLAASGLTTREACGNSVRNITACPFAGVARDEVFDVTPYAEALTRHLLRGPLSAILPRKFKIGFEGCPDDHAFASINDIGWWAQVRDVGGSTERGFRVTVGGGTSILPRSGMTLFEYVPANRIFDAADAILRVYHRFGDYEHKQRNRMKFLIKAMGWDKYRDEVLRAYDDICAEGGTPFPFDPDNPSVEEAPDWMLPEAATLEATAARVAASTVKGPGIVPHVNPWLVWDADAFAAWQQTNVLPQKQDGYVAVIARVPLGDLTAQQFRVLADLAATFGDGTIRMTPDQNLVFRWVREGQVPLFYRHLAAASLGRPNAQTMADVVSCPGAESCRLAVTASRGLGRLLTDHLEAHPEIVEAARSAHIKISGCPNGCGQHHVADIGFQGSIRKLGERAVPQYFVMVGGAVAADGANFGRVAAKVPARRCPEALERLIALYREQHAPGESAAQFYRRIDFAVIKKTLADLEPLAADQAEPQDFIDLGEDTEYKQVVLDGECSA
ncbi:MAG: nitrite/sulfite reductase [Luteitalea sp.]|nr:nitrite/sulfite reductase [Luteitalea sp.]